MLGNQSQALCVLKEIIMQDIVFEILVYLDLDIINKYHTQIHQEVPLLLKRMVICEHKQRRQED